MSNGYKERLPASSFSQPPPLHTVNPVFTDWLTLSPSLVSFPWLRLLLLNVLFFVDVIPLWNSLPSIFVSSSSISSFKRLISLPPFGSVLLCTFVLVSLSLCVRVWGDTYTTSSSAILSTHMQLVLRIFMQKKKKNSYVCYPIYLHVSCHCTSRIITGRSTVCSKINASSALQLAILTPVTSVVVVHSCLLHSEP